MQEGLQTHRGTLINVVFSSFADWSSVARRVGWALTLALVILLIQSTFWDARVPWALKLAVAAVAVLSARRPADGLLVIAGLVPFGHVLVTSVWHAYPFALAEALVLAFLAGYLWRQRPGTLDASDPADHLAVPSRLYALVVLASCAVQYSVLQIWHDYPLRYAASFVDYLATGYLTRVLDPRPFVDGRGFVWTAAMLLEGVALLRCASTLCRSQPALARRLTNVVIAAGAAVAVLSFYEDVSVAWSLSQPIASTMAIRGGSPAIPSINTAGPYFMMLAFAAIGTALASRVYRFPSLMAVVICIGAMWLTQTRSAIVAGLAVLAASAVWLAMARGVRLRASIAVAIACAAALAVGVSLVVYRPFYVFASGVNRWPAGTSLHFRFLLSMTAWRMTLSHPFFGVGVGQYEQWFREFSSPELLAVHPINNAHNYFLWASAELGLVGIALFLWILGATVARCWTQLRVHELDYRFLGTFAGLVAFIITWAIGQPLAVPQVAYTFWIMLGLLAGSCTDTAPPVVSGRRHLLLTRIALAATVLLVVGSVPIRANRAIDDIDLSHVSYGFYNPGTADDRNFRWAGPHITFFMRQSVRAINVPLAAKLPDTPNGAEVSILVDGHPADRIMLSDRDWRDIRISAPHSERRFWRVDLHVTPNGPAANLPENRRRVAVAAIAAVRREEDP